MKLVLIIDKEIGVPRAMVIASLVGIALLSGCSSSAQSAGSTQKVRVVAATDVWGDITAQIAGSRVEITSIINNPDADPHSYEANARNQLALSRAKLVIENGGGYDDFMQRMVSAAGTDPTVLNVVRLSGITAPPGGDLNEHVWYDFPTVGRFVDAITSNLARLDPTGGKDFHANASRFESELANLEDEERSIKAADAGAGVAITEPVPVYLLQACGLVNETPPAFSRSVEDGTDVSPSVLAQTLALFSGHRVKLLAYNQQTSDSQTQQVLAAARRYRVAVVPVTETLPAGKNYLTWMASNLEAIRTALS